MRPVNLIPAEDRKRSRIHPGGSNPLAYLVVGGLVAILAGVTALVMTGNTIAEREAEVVSLEQEEAAALAHADSLRAFSDFASAEQARRATITSLATSRFDWERVLRELALVIPPNVTLKSLSGAVAAGGSSAGASDLGAGIAGPSLALEGCALGHEGVAELVAALHDIDGVTRVGLANSEEEVTGNASSAVAPAADGTCTGGAAMFSIVVAFDAVSVEAGATPTAPAAPEVAAVSTDDGGVGAVTQESAEAADSVEQGTDNANRVVDQTLGAGQ